MDEKTREAVALAIGKVCWGGGVIPKGNWLKAADAAIDTYNKGKEDGSNGI
jgi:hypothetical protein